MFVDGNYSGLGYLVLFGYILVLISIILSIIISIILRNRVFHRLKEIESKNKRIIVNIIYFITMVPTLSLILSFVLLLTVI
jgi:hypothetical protein